MVPFYGWGSTASRLEPLREGGLLFTTKFPEIPGNRLKVEQGFDVSISKHLNHSKKHSKLPMKMLVMLYACNLTKKWFYYGCLSRNSAKCFTTVIL